MGTSVATELMAHNGGQRTAHRTINYIELPDTAHCPQIEQPELISAALGKALAGATWP
jgi:pimeloyl-ACP methyl ester carboxylesterase